MANPATQPALTLDEEKHILRILRDISFYDELRAEPATIDFNFQDLRTLRDEVRRLRDENSAVKARLFRLQLAIQRAIESDKP